MGCCASEWPRWVKRVATIFILVLILVFWLCFLAGAATSMERCKKLRSPDPKAKGYLETDTGFAALRDVGLAPLSPLQSQDDQCQQYFSVTWFLVALQFIVMIVALLCTLIPVMRECMDQSLVPFFTMLCAVYIIQCYQFTMVMHALENGVGYINLATAGSSTEVLLLANDAKGKLTDMKTGLTVAVAGMAALVVANSIYIVFVLAAHGVMTPMLILGRPKVTKSTGADPASPNYVAAPLGGVAVVTMAGTGKHLEGMPPPAGTPSTYTPSPQTTGGYPPQVVSTTPYNPAVPPTGTAYPPNGPPHAAYPGM